MNNLQIFTSPEFGQIRTLQLEGETWFIGKDVCEALGYTNHLKALSDHVKENHKGVTNCDTLGGPQKVGDTYKKSTVCFIGKWCFSAYWEIKSLLVPVRC